MYIFDNCIQGLQCCFSGLIRDHNMYYYHNYYENEDSLIYISFWALYMLAIFFLDTKMFSENWVSFESLSHV